jgi:hypothetical protein
MVKLHNNKRYRELDLENYYFVISSSRFNSNNNNTYQTNILLCNYDVIEKDTLLYSLTYDVKL